jgi:23S rRNA (guanosine2251-2'-O)-methyltransferase
MMVKKSRAFSSRKHEHTDWNATVGVREEADLFRVLENRTVPPFLLVLDNVQDPHNLGACLRVADGAGVQAVIVPKDRSVGLTDTVRTVACGAAEHVPLIQVVNLARTLDQLKDAGIWTVGTTDRTEQSIYQVDLTGPLALVMGSEGTGLRRLTAEKCDFLVSIPMFGSVSSLNVSVATGICLYEAVRQRTGKQR